MSTPPPRSPRKIKPKARAKTSKSSHEERPAPVLRGLTVVVTNLIKLGGLALAVNEIMIRPELRESAIAFCALCILGAQAAEDMFLRAIDRFFSSMPAASEEGEE